MRIFVLTSLLLCFSFLAKPAFASRDTITIVGSSTVFPFSKVVSERFGRKTPYKSPKVEPTGTGGGFKEFCKGLGISTPDIANASRKIKASEYKACQSNGVRGIIEVHIGYDGIVLANSVGAERFSLELKDLFLALAKHVPDPNAEASFIENPYKRWSEVNPNLPNKTISVLGPPPTSGTRDAFVELVMEGGCSQFPSIRALKESNGSRYKALCHGIREDRAFIEVGENDNLIVRKLKENNDTLGIFGFSFLDQNADKVHAAEIDGRLPSFETISQGEYIVSRPLYFYLKKAHIEMIPGVREFLAEFMSDSATGAEGYLTDKGLIPLLGEEREKIIKRVNDLEIYEPAP